MTEATAAVETQEQTQTVIPDAKAAPAPEVDKAKGDEVEAIQYEETGDPKLDLALGFFGRMGLDVEHPAIAAAVAGDFSLLEATLASNPKAQGWQQYVALAKEAHGNAEKVKQEGQQKVVDAVSSTLEKKGLTNDEWGTVIEWVRENGDEGEKAELNQLLATPLGAKAVTAYLIDLYREASGTEFKPQASAVKADAAALPKQAPANTAPISRVEFSRESEKLARKLGAGYMDSPEFKQLYNRYRGRN
ncbi:head scaffolding protein [Pseudomonas phage vB_PpuP-Kurepalu-1]